LIDPNEKNFQKLTKTC